MKENEVKESLDAHDRLFMKYEHGMINMVVTIRANSIKGATVYETICALEEALGNVRADMVEWKFEEKSK